MLRDCKNPNIIAYYGSYLRRDKLWIAMEFCGGGSLQDIYNGESKSCPDRYPVLSWTLSIVSFQSHRTVDRDPDRLHLSRDAQRPQLFAQYGQNASRHQRGQHFAHRRGRGQASRFRRLGSNNSDSGQTQVVHWHAILDGMLWMDGSLLQKAVVKR